MGSTYDIDLGYCLLRSFSGKSAEFDPEYTRYQLESAPGAPYDSSMSDLLVVERNMRYRRERIRGHLSPQEVLVTVSSFPSLGAAETFTEPPIDPGDPNSRRSSSFPDEIISHHTRYRWVHWYLKLDPIDLMNSLGH